MANKNEYFSVTSDIFRDEKFTIQFTNKIEQSHTLPTNDELRTAIHKLKKYSDLPPNMHEEYANSECINDLCEYYEYLENRYQMAKKQKK
jgi:hypothetical protein